MRKNIKGCLLFDWGDTLMRDYSSFDGPMKDWPVVEAMPAARETLALLHPDWTLALATNAEASEEADIREALQRVDLDQYLDKIYCFRRIRAKKPSREFFRYILRDLDLDPSRVIMIGDSYENDIQGAVASGLHAIWFNFQTLEVRMDDLSRTVHRLSEIPEILKDF